MSQDPTRNPSAKLEVTENTLKDVKVADSLCHYFTTDDKTNNVQQEQQEVIGAKNMQEEKISSDTAVEETFEYMQAKEIEGRNLEIDEEFSSNIQQGQNEVGKAKNQLSKKNLAMTEKTLEDEGEEEEVQCFNSTVYHKSNTNVQQEHAEVREPTIMQQEQISSDTIVQKTFEDEGKADDESFWLVMDDEFIKSIQQEQEEGRRANKKQKRNTQSTKIHVTCFEDLYRLTEEVLGEGASAKVQTCLDIYTHKEYAVKIIEKTPYMNRNCVLKEVETLHQCQNHPNIVDLLMYFENNERFFLVFKKIKGGTLLTRMKEKQCLSEKEASQVINDLANALSYLHRKGIAHRDLKPANILCVYPDKVSPVKICDFDLSSGIKFNSDFTSPLVTPALFTPVGSMEYMAPEIVQGFIREVISYDKRCDLWSLGVIMYVLLCGYSPFYGNCGDECDRKKGKYCYKCRNAVPTKILDGRYVYPEKEWSCISDDAKDLCGKLLLKDPNCRISAEEILNHSWITRHASNSSE